MSHDHGSIIEDKSEQKTLASYIVGFLLCLVLTLIAFGLVEMRILTTAALYISLAALAIIQLFVQTICFLNVSVFGIWHHGGLRGVRYFQ